MDSDRRLELNLWYHVLNCGLRPTIAGETHFPCFSGQRIGIGRTYVKVDGTLQMTPGSVDFAMAEATLVTEPVT